MAMSLERGRDLVCDLSSYISIDSRYECCGQVNRRRVHNGVEEISELLLRVPQNCSPASPHPAGSSPRPGRS
jgi:hypothetical protein